MKSLLWPVFFVVMLVLAGSILYFYIGFESRSSGTDEVTDEEVVDPTIAINQKGLADIASKSDLIRVTGIEPGKSITSPLTLSGEARGTWYFEASFPVDLTDRNGQVIASAIMQAKSDWMTEDFVPFGGELNFKSTYVPGDPIFMKQGSLIFKKDNPSGLPENADQLVIPILFEDSVEPTPFTLSIPQKVTIYDGIEVSDSIKTLDLHSRGLSGSLKAEIRLLTKLVELDISSNNFTGLPAEIGQLTNLQVLNLSNNPLTGLPQELGNLSNLRVLDLRGTQYSEFDLDIIKQTLPESVDIITDEIVTDEEIVTE